MIRALLVDDEAPARSELKRFLKGIPDFQLVGEATNGQEALDTVKQLKPDMVFMDIQMPRMNGLEAARALVLTGNPPLVVFVTAYDQYAIEAFELNAIDYLLKPYDEERFKKTCARIRRSLADQSQVKDKLSSLRNYLEKEKPLKILGHKRNSRDRIFIHEEEVLYFSVHLTEVVGHMKNGNQLLINTTLKSLLEMLDPVRFQQAHRAYVVNLNQVEKVTPLFSGNFTLTLKDPAHTSLPLSRRYAKKLKEFLKW